MTELPNDKIVTCGVCGTVLTEWTPDPDYPGALLNSHECVDRPAKHVVEEPAPIA